MEAPASSVPEAPASGVQPAGALRVDGTRLVDASGQPVRLRGVSTHGLAWYPQYVNEDCFRQLRDWGANVVRLAMYTAEYGGYCSGGDQEALKDLVRAGVGYAGELGMYAIVDWHILSDGDPNTHLAEALDFFDEMSAEFADQPFVLYEICNEPNGGVTWAQVKSYAEQVIPVIRANAPDAVILVGSPTWSQDVDQAAADPIQGYGNLMYTLHFYAATHTGALRDRAQAALDAGLPLFVSEFGICDASGSGAIDKTQAGLWMDLLDRYGVSYVAWNLSNKDETSAMFLPSCTKTGGFTAADLSPSGQWVVERLSGGPLPEAPEPSEAPAPSGEPEPSESGTAPADGTELEVSAVLVNSWEENGRTVRQYSLTVTNRSGRSRSGWAVELAFDGEIELLNSWNGDFEADGAVLRVSSKDYNGSLAPGASAADVGFIVTGGALS